MKMIVAVIQPTRLRNVQQALGQCGVERMTILDAQEFPWHGAEVPIVSGARKRAEVRRKVTIELAVNDDFVDRAVDAIYKAARTGKLGNDGDGKIFVLPLAEAIQLSPVVRGKGAI